MKKQIIISGILLLLVYSIYSQPQAFKYQTVVRDVAGNILVNQNVSFQLSILQDSPTGLSIYTETHLSVTNDHGVVNLTIGTGSVVSGNFTTINWGENLHYLKIELLDYPMVLKN